ncbi:hypothetical protein [Romboutsia lituseburensis]|uniref:Uncharacterized protein n=1 Tax=Romboutsia lituseburensis DSM 797 TaxID=1121325 RepID=A0A1G9S728_9FIRM|nr:hypothetical protein [Romboutsia lituseburensis]CEH32936.1 Hypothetical protein RLITU_0326 [Romboutsia lituseburensis]SDM30575.1 hypothetical protein SAMN04515677_10892 [Romboutsia lituseburensis DSM 797]
MNSKIDKDGFLFNIFGSVRKIIALLLTIVFCYLSIDGKVTQEQFIPVFSMVLGYYFGRSTALDIPGKKKNQIENSTDIIPPTDQDEEDQK